MFVDKIVKEIDRYLESHSSRYFLLKKLNRYKKILKEYKHINWRDIIGYEKKWQRLRRKYKQICFYGIEFVSIGETVPRLFNLINDSEQGDRETLRVVLPTFYVSYVGGIYNRRLYDLFGKKVYFVKDSNIDFWTYVICLHTKQIYTDGFNRYISSRLGGTKTFPDKPLLPFSEEEISEGEDKLRKMGVDGEFICVYARESNVKTVDFSKRHGYESKCRNCELSTFVKTSRFFYKRNIPSVRLGKYETKECNESTIIDYANEHYDEFMDFYLFSKCRFLIGCDGGLIGVCGYWGRPVLMTNGINLCYGWESWPDTGYDMYIPKKFYSKKKRRYLNLYETLDIMNICGIFTSNFVKKGIVLEDNTEDEILDAATELNDRLEHIWIESEEEKIHYKKYWEIMDKWKREHSYVVSRKASGYTGYTMCFIRLSYNYLKNNLYLLDVNYSEQSV